MCWIDCCQGLSLASYSSRYRATINTNQNNAALQDAIRDLKEMEQAFDEADQWYWKAHAARQMAVDRPKDSGNEELSELLVQLKADLAKRAKQPDQQQAAPPIDDFSDNGTKKRRWKGRGTHHSPRPILISPHSPAPLPTLTTCCDPFST